jgi:hypothetical protein
MQTPVLPKSEGFTPVAPMLFTSQLTLPFFVYWLLFDNVLWCLF